MLLIINNVIIIQRKPSSVVIYFHNDDNIMKIVYTSRFQTAKLLGPPCGIGEY